MANASPTAGAKVPGTQAGRPGVFPTDAMQVGIHSDLRAASKHKQQVSSVLHLKKESVGHRGNPTAYSTKKAIAFPKRGK